MRLAVNMADSALALRVAKVLGFKTQCGTSPSNQNIKYLMLDGIYSEDEPGVCYILMLKLRNTVNLIILKGE